MQDINIKALKDAAYAALSSGHIEGDCDIFTITAFSSMARPEVVLALIDRLEQAHALLQDLDPLFSRNQDNSGLVSCVPDDESFFPLRWLKDDTIGDYEGVFVGNPFTT